MTKPIATAVLGPDGRVRHRLHARYLRLLHKADEVIRFFAGMGDEHAACVSENVQKLAQRYSAPAKLNRKAKGGQDKAVPKGDRS